MRAHAMKGFARTSIQASKELSKSEAVPVYKNILDRETGELKRVLDCYLCKSCDALVKKRPKT